MPDPRNDTSLLFSLDQVKAIARGAPSAGTRAESSGLIDIRAMAAMAPTAPPAAVASLLPVPVFSTVAPTPILLPAERSSTPGWMWGLLGAIAVAVVGLAALLLVLLRNTPPANPPIPVPAPITAPPPSLAPATPPPPAPIIAPVAPPMPAPAVAAVRPREHRAAARQKPAPSPTPTAPAPVRTAAPAPRPGPRSELEILIDQASPTTAPAPTARPIPVPADSLPATPARGDIVSAMQAARPRFDACFAKYHIPGTIPLQLVLAGSGRVQAATAGGALAGTPTADCVAQAARGASFPRFQQTSYSITWPVILH